MAITKVFLLSVPLEKDYSHTLWFQTPEAQHKYFVDLIKAAYSHNDFTYQRKDGVIRVPEQIDTLWKEGINYVMYQNTDYNEKWFYSFITDMKYINDGRTDVTIQTDCIQTWMFEMQIKPCFVEREHSRTDILGENTIPEGLETGEYASNKHTKSGYASEDLYIVFGATKDPDKADVTGLSYNNIYSGVRYFGFENTISGVNRLNEVLGTYDTNGIADAITSMFMAPAPLVVKNEDADHIPGTNMLSYYYINSPELTTGDNAFPGATIEISNGTLDGYTPRNQKLLCYPYRYLLVANNSGASAPMKYERFYTVDGEGNRTNIDPRFVIEGVLTPGCSIRMVPLNYNGAPRNDEEGINMGKFPALNWNSDVYTNWLTQNGVNIALEIASGVGQIVAGTAVAMGTGGLATAVGGGTVVGGVSQIAGTLSQVYTQSFAPPQAKGNLNSGDIVTASDQNDFHFYDMSIKAEYARIIDDYFDMYGYKTHRVKVPETNHRFTYWFTKTIDANITGQIPQGDLQIIKDCYNKGITFWKRPGVFKDYTQPNYAMGNGETEE